MKKGIFAWLSLVAALLFVTPGISAAAEETQAVSLEGLSAEQVKQIQSQVQAARQNASPELSAVSKASEIGRMLGASLVATAREVGIAVNDFAKSDVGRIVTVVLVWKYIGHDILGVGVGLMFLLAGVPIGLCIARAAYIDQVNKEYAVATYLWGMFSRRVLVKKEVVKRDYLSESRGLQVAIGYGATALSVVIGLSCMF